MNFRSRTPAVTFPIKAVAGIAVLCLLAALVRFFATAKNSPPPRNDSASAKNPSPLKPISAPRVVSVPSAPTAPFAPAETDATIPLVAAHAARSTAATKISLPPPPSGDYDLTLTAEQIDAIVEARYGGLFQSLGLPPESLARLRALLSERQQVAVDAANTALFFGMNPVRDLPAIQRAVAQFETAIDIRIRTELGESVSAACRDYDRTLRGRNLVADFAQLAADARDPLAAEQQKRVVQILTDTPAKEFPGNLAQVIYGGTNARASISDEAIAAAAAVLSAPQLELLRELQRRASPDDVP